MKKIKIYNLLILSLVFNWFIGSGWELYRIDFRGEESIAIISMWLILLIIIPVYWFLLYILSKTKIYDKIELKLNKYRKYFWLVFFLIPTFLLFLDIEVSSVFLIPVLLLNYFSIL